MNGQSQTVWALWAILAILLSFLFANVSVITLTVTLTLTLTCVGAVLLPAPTHGLHFLEPGQSLSAPLCR